jgi:uncharacterized protein YyaL (SSP411 family)
VRREYDALVTNRLAHERSPYLLQHATNPVDWHAWNDDAIARARAEDKPIFLSIGYSTCHWCHVMAHESFENAGIAALLNRDFVSIKVDREERPDVDRVYMAFVQATTGQGGWPMTVFLTPELQPFYGGTYFPPTSRWGRPGFADLVSEIARVWKEERPRARQAAAELTERLRAVTVGAESESEVAAPDALTAAVAQFRTAFDARHAGFGPGPKFPRPAELLFLLRQPPDGVEPSAVAMATATLRAMALGGMRDHVGGGFHRYSVDAQWRVPHFEKMLYDQAQLVLACVEAAQVTGEEFYASVAEDTLQYVLREMRSPEGGFYSAEDADSIPPEEAGAATPHRKEGAFYVWTSEEMDELLGPDSDVASQRFGVEPGGNAPEDPQGEFTGKNILFIAQPIAAIASRTRSPEAEVMDALGRIRLALFERRATRPRPHLDDKVLTAWNGLMIAAFARAARALPATRHASAYREAAGAAARFIRTTLWRAGDEVLLRRFRDGDAAIEGYAEDYAYLVWGLLELFQSTGEAEWLEWAMTLQRRQDELFWDEADGAWFSTTGTDPHVLLRLKEDYDGAEPSASSVGALNCLTLWHLTSEDGYRVRAERTLARFGPRVGAAGRVVPMMLCALSQWHAPSSQIVITGSGSPSARPLESAVATRYLPFAVHIPVNARTATAIARLLPFVAGMPPDEPAVYVCQDFTCQRPVTSVEALREVLP